MYCVNVRVYRSSRYRRNVHKCCQQQSKVEIPSTISTSWLVSSIQSPGYKPLTSYFSRIFPLNKLETLPCASRPVCLRLITRPQPSNPCTTHPESQIPQQPPNDLLIPLPYRPLDIPKPTPRPDPPIAHHLLHRTTDARVRAERPSRSRRVGGEDGRG
jgi:hypothetical protein